MIICNACVVLFIKICSYIVDMTGKVVVYVCKIKYGNPVL